ncbi:glycosyltransferase family 4 protein [Mucilaginibacter sp. UYCu711]|uniref:glycosyltransferase family 4 protein n=1 Tax=Mucilaginibacter sp. UYCu711 TaxID=3156339 RepID=UPI003D25C8EA
MRIAIITTHPIQYYAPVFKLLAQQVEVKVFYTWGAASIEKHDPGFNKTIKWDINLLDAYDYQWLQNTSDDPGSHHFYGIVNPTIITEIEAWKPNTLLVYGWAYKSHLIVMRHFKNKIPVLFRGDSTLLDEKPGLKNAIRSIYLKWVYDTVDYAFYTGINNRAYFKKYGLRDDQLIFAPHAVDNDRFADPKEKEVDKLKHLLGLNTDSIVILFAGKLEVKKDPALLLKAFININAANTHLLFVGNGVLKDELKQQAILNPNIHFMDFKNQTYMPIIYQTCDIFCLPSIGPGETWGLAVNEAMSCSKAVLVSDKVGCAPDLVKSNQNGMVFTAGSIKDIGDKLTYLLNKGKTGLTHMGNISKHVIEDWSFTRQASAIVNYKNGSNQ